MNGTRTADEIRAIPKIDVHAHLFSRGPVPAQEEIDMLLRLSRRANIGRTVLLGNVVMGEPSNAAPSPESVRTINDHTLFALRAHPEAFLGFCYLNPAHPVTFLLEEIDRCIVQEGMRGIKLWICVPPTDERVGPIMEKAAELDVPVLQHSWYNQELGDHTDPTPAQVAEMGRRFPDVRIIMAHLGGGGCRGVLDIEDVPNISIDTAGSQPEAGLVDYAVQHLGAERVVFGTDWPVRDIAVQIGRVAGADLTAEQRRLIFRQNAARLLGLAEERE